MTRCFYHPDVDTTLRCDLCGKPVCAACIKEAEGHSVCERCAARAAKHGYSATKEQIEQAKTPFWVGLVIPGLAQLLKGEICKGSLLLLYFLLACYAEMGGLVVLAYGISAWDCFWPLVNEESRGSAFINFRQFSGIVIIFVGALLLANNLTHAIAALSQDTARLIASGITIALGLFVILYHMANGKEEATHES